MYNYELLVQAIVGQAAKDYRAARRMLQKKPNHPEAKKRLKETEEFFKSDWYFGLTGTDGRYALTKLKEEFEHE